MKWQGEIMEELLQARIFFGGVARSNVPSPEHLLSGSALTAAAAQRTSFLNLPTQAVEVYIRL